MKRPSLILSLPFLASLFAANAFAIPLAQRGQVPSLLLTDPEGVEHAVVISKRADDASIYDAVNAPNPGAIPHPADFTPLNLDPEVARLSTPPASYSDPAFFDKCCKKACLFCPDDDIQSCGCPADCGDIVASTLCFGLGPITGVAEAPVVSKRGLTDAANVEANKFREGRKIRKFGYRKERTIQETGSEVEVHEDCFCTPTQLNEGVCTCGDSLLVPGQATTLGYASIPPATTTSTIYATTTTQISEATETVTVPACGCTNDCKLNCTTDDCICPQFCDPRYLCPGDDAGDGVVLKKRGHGYDSSSDKDEHDKYGSERDEDYEAEHEESYGSDHDDYDEFDNYENDRVGPHFVQHVEPSYSEPSYGFGDSYDQHQQSTHRYEQGKPHKHPKPVDHHIKAPKAPKINAQGVVGDIVSARLEKEKKDKPKVHKEVKNRLAHSKLHGHHDKVHGYHDKGNEYYNETPRVEVKQAIDLEVNHDGYGQKEKVETVIEKPDRFGTFATTVDFADGAKAGGYVIDKKKVYVNGVLAESTKVEESAQEYLNTPLDSNGNPISPLGLIHPANPTQAAAILGQVPTHNVLFEFPDQTVGNNGNSGSDSGMESQDNYDSDSDGYQSEWDMLAKAFPDDLSHKKRVKKVKHVKAPVVIQEEHIEIEEPIHYETLEYDEHDHADDYDHGHEYESDDSDHEHHHHDDEYDHDVHDHYAGEVVIGEPIIINTNTPHSSISHTGSEECPYKLKSEPCPYEAAGLICPHITRHIDGDAHVAGEVVVGAPISITRTPINSHSTSTHPCPYKLAAAPCPDEVAGKICSHTKVKTVEESFTVPHDIHHHHHHHVCPYKAASQACPDEVQGKTCSHVHVDIKPLHQQDDYKHLEPATIITETDAVKIKQGKPQRHWKHRPEYRGKNYLKAEVVKGKDEIQTQEAEYLDFGNVPAERLDNEIDHDGHDHHHEHHEHEHGQSIEIGDGDIHELIEKKEEELKEEIIGDEHKSDGPEPIVIYAPWK